MLAQRRKEANLDDLSYKSGLQKVAAPPQSDLHPPSIRAALHHTVINDPARSLGTSLDPMTNDVPGRDHVTGGGLWLSATSQQVESATGRGWNAARGGGGRVHIPVSEFWWLIIPAPLTSRLTVSHHLHVLLVGAKQKELNSLVDVIVKHFVPLV